jgi:nucleotide-binding universal stress UspA family protein
MRILLATDGSESAREAVDFVARFPFPADTAITVLSVVKHIEHRAEVLDESRRVALEESHEGAASEAETLIQQQAQILREAGWTCSTELRVGHPAEEIVLAAEELNVDLIAVGSHGLSGFKRFLLGSVSNQVLQSAHCSVLIVKKFEEVCADEQPKAEDGWRLLVAFDDSAPARRAVEFCASLPLDESVVVDVLTVLPMVRLFRQDIRQELNSIWQETKEAEKAALAAAAAEIGRTAPNVRTELVESGDVSHAILEAGERLGADLIVMGHKGKGAIERFLMGSVTPRVAHHTCRSLLAVRI